MSYFYYDDDGELHKVPEGEQYERKKTKQRLTSEVEALEASYSERVDSDEDIPRRRTVLQKKARSLLSELEERQQAGEDLDDLVKRVKSIRRKLE